jgi:hypothetical protein
MSNPPQLDRRTILEAVEEMKDKTTEFAAKERAVYVETQVNKIRAMVAGGATESDIKLKFPEFIAEYPTLFQYAIKPGFDANSFRIMLTMLNRMGDKQMSQHQASVIVGQRMADKYINPRFGPSSGSNASN